MHWLTRRAPSDITAMRLLSRLVFPNRNAGGDQPGRSEYMFIPHMMIHHMLRPDERRS